MCANLMKGYFLDAEEIISTLKMTKFDGEYWVLRESL